jgi:hypothetical protein
MLGSKKPEILCSGNRMFLSDRLNLPELFMGSLAEKVRLIIINKGTLVYDGIRPKAKGGVEKLFKKLVRD